MHRKGKGGKGEKDGAEMWEWNGRLGKDGSEQAGKVGREESK